MDLLKIESAHFYDARKEGGRAVRLCVCAAHRYPAADRRKVLGIGSKAVPPRAEIRIEFPASIFLVGIR
jgi:hypothetical protein